MLPPRSASDEVFDHTSHPSQVGNVNEIEWRSSHEILHACRSPDVLREHLVGSCVITIKTRRERAEARDHRGPAMRYDGSVMH